MQMKNSVLCVSSCGGHFKQIVDITQNICTCQKTFVVNDYVKTVKNQRLIRIAHAERNLKQIINFYEAYKIIKREKPKLILSTGASPAVVFCIVGKLFKVPTVYVESFSRVTSLSLTGRMMRYLADEFIVQWPTLQKKYPNAKYYGNLL